MISKATLLCFSAALAFTAIYVSEVQAKVIPPEEVEVPGTYKQDTGYSTEDMDKYMAAMGFSAEAQKDIHDDKHLWIVITKNGDKWTIKKITPKKTWDLTFESGKEFEATLLDGRKIKSTVTVQDRGEKPTIHRVFKMEGFDGTSDYKFCKMGFNLTLAAKEAKVDLRFDRVDMSSDSTPH